MSNRSAGVRASIAAVGAALAATAAALDPLEFVAGWPIEAPADAKVFDVPLTAEVYAAANGIEQLAVLDANGEPQPFFRRSPPPTAPTEQRVVLEASPLYAGGAGGGPSVGVTTSARGTSVTVTPGAPSSSAVTGFVLDARAVTTAPIALDLDWRALPQPFLLEVSVEQSTDLTNWRGVGRGSVAELAIGDAEVRHARVPVRAAAGGYLRVTPSSAVADWHLLRATLVSSTTEPAAPLRVRVPPLAAGAGPEEPVPDALYFDAGGTLPVASVALGFAAGDGWARATVAASRTLDGPWTPVAYGELFYTAVVRRPRIREHARRRRPAGSSLLARRAGGAAARSRRRARAHLPAGVSARGRQRRCAVLARGRHVGGGGRPRRDAIVRVVGARRRRPMWCRSRRSAQGASSAARPRSWPCARFPGAPPRCGAC